MAGYGIIALGLLGASVYTSASSMFCSQCVEFKESLSKEQELKYNEIATQRFRNYLVGLLIGIVLAVIYYYTCCKNKSLTYTNTSIIIALILGSQYLYYTLAPKRSMLLELTNDDQRAKWLSVYNTMKTRYHVGFFIGIVACLAFCQSLH